jgi:hypothetical protein
MPKQRARKKEGQLALVWKLGTHDTSGSLIGLLSSQSRSVPLNSREMG